MIWMLSGLSEINWNYRLQRLQLLLSLKINQMYLQLVPKQPTLSLDSRSCKDLHSRRKRKKLWNLMQPRTWKRRARNWPEKTNTSEDNIKKREASLSPPMERWLMLMFAGICSKWMNQNMLRPTQTRTPNQRVTLSGQVMISLIEARSKIHKAQQISNIWKQRQQGWNMRMVTLQLSLTRHRVFWNSKLISRRRTGNITSKKRKERSCWLSLILWKLKKWPRELMVKQKF